MSAGVRFAEGGEHLDTTGRCHRARPRAPDGSCRCPAVPPRRPPRRGHRSRGPTSPRRRTSPSADRPDSTQQRRAARRSSAMPSSRRAGTGVVGALDVHHLGVAQRRRALNQSRGGRAEHHPTRRRHRLHPLRHPDLLTDRGVTQSARTDLTGDHLTGVQSHPQLQIHAVAVVRPRRPAARSPPECPTPPRQARRAWSSNATGAPNTAMMPSPVNLSTVPP